MLTELVNIAVIRWTYISHKVYSVLYCAKVWHIDIDRDTN